jgi:hypothetical protein
LPDAGKASYANKQREAAEKQFQEYKAEAQKSMKEEYNARLAEIERKLGDTLSRLSTTTDQIRSATGIAHAKRHAIGISGSTIKPQSPKDRIGHASDL